MLNSEHGDIPCGTDLNLTKGPDMFTVKKAVAVSFLVPALALVACEETNRDANNTDNKAETANQTTPNQAMSKVVEMHQKVASTLEGVTDLESAQDAAGELREINEDIMNSQGTFAALKNLSDDQESQLKSEYQTELDQANNAIQEQLDRIGRDAPDAKSVVQSMVEDIQSQMSDYEL